jgi:hypothetical protein
VVEGVGRTLKGRDMSRVRDAVWSQTGFYGWSFCRYMEIKVLVTIVFFFFKKKIAYDFFLGNDSAELIRLWNESTQ